MRHLLGLEDLSAAEITRVLDAAREFVGVGVGAAEKRADLKGKVVVNLFFEPSTRTRTSFGLAARRLGADTLDFTPGGSSISKGETFIDTAKNIEAMGIDVVVVRHSSPGAPHLLAQHLRRTRVVNAGDGAHEHPTQGLLDIFTIRQRQGPGRGADGRPRRRHRPQPGGPQQHPRPARSSGAKVIVCGPPTLVPAERRRAGRRGGAPPRRHPAALRRGQRAAHPVRAAAERAVPVDPRVLPACSAWTASGCGGRSRTCCCWPRARSTAAWR